MTNLDDLNNLAAMILAASCEKDEYLVSKKRDPNKERTSFYNATKRSYSSLTSNMTGGVTKYYNYKNNKEISWANDTYNHFSDGENINYLLDIMMPEERPSTSFLNNVGHLALFEYFILDYTNQHYYLAICYDPSNNTFMQDITYLNIKTHPWDYDNNEYGSWEGESLKPVNFLELLDMAPEIIHDLGSSSNIGYMNIYNYIKTCAKKSE